MKNNLFKILFTFCLITFTFLSLSAEALAKPKVVLFYADWNSACRSVKTNVESIVSTYGNKVDLIELNIDSSTTPDKSRILGLPVPQTIPYIVLIGKKGQILEEKVIKNQSASQLKNELDSYLMPEL